MDFYVATGFVLTPVYSCVDASGSRFIEAVLTCLQGALEKLLLFVTIVAMIFFPHSLLAVVFNEFLFIDFELCCIVDSTSTAFPLAAFVLSSVAVCLCNGSVHQMHSDGSLLQLHHFFILILLSGLCMPPQLLLFSSSAVWFWKIFLNIQSPSYHTPLRMYLYFHLILS